MNRREFLKGSALAGLSSAFLPLLPRAVSAPRALVGQPRIDALPEWCVCVGTDVVCCRGNGEWRNRPGTLVKYRGSMKGIQTLSKTVSWLHFGDLHELTLETDYEEIIGDYGDVEKIIYFGTGSMEIILKGFWLVELGPVDAGETNVSETFGLKALRPMF